jgi:Family of unknown function (DUF6535)
MRKWPWAFNSTSAISYQPRIQAWPTQMHKQAMRLQIPKTNRLLSKLTLSINMKDRTDGFASRPASEATLNDILDTMQDSDTFQRTGKDVPSRFWSAYERVAKQHDDELLERHNGDLDVLLIFVRATFLASTWPQWTPSLRPVYSQPSARPSL